LGEAIGKEAAKKTPTTM